MTNSRSRSLVVPVAQDGAELLRSLQHGADAFRLAPKHLVEPLGRRAGTMIARLSEHAANHLG